MIDQAAADDRDPGSGAGVGGGVVPPVPSRKRTSQRLNPGRGAGSPLGRFGIDHIRAAHEHSSAIVARTPVLSAGSLAERFGGPAMLKAENLQRTGSFKIRGVLNKLRSLPAGTEGVVAGSAGNHAQALAYGARASGLRCAIFMPYDAAVSKVEAVQAFGATVRQEAASVDECVALARASSDQSGWGFVHPFDDADIVMGQAGVGWEVAEDAPGVAQVVVPLGGGGLAAGVALAVKAVLPGVRVIGVQAEACAPYSSSLRAGVPVPVAQARATLADGIAIKRPGDLTLPLVLRWVDDVVVVTEDQIANAMMLLLQRSKLVSEGAGAAGVAAMLSGAVSPVPNGPTLAVVSGGNVDVSTLAAVAARSETGAGRRFRLFTRVADRPGGLSALLGQVAQLGGNVLDVSHVRDGVTLEVGQTGVLLTVELAVAGQGDHLVQGLRLAGYDASPAA